MLWEDTPEGKVMSLMRIVRNQRYCALKLAFLDMEGGIFLITGVVSLSDHGV